MKYLISSAQIICLAAANFRDYEQVKLTKKDEDFSELETRFNCPLTKRPWQYRPFGCHNKHEHLKDDDRFSNIKWFDPESNECQFFDICMRSCKSVRAPQNLCINQDTKTVEHGIGCNCKCSYVCIKTLSEMHAADQTNSGETRSLALLNTDQRFITLSGKGILDEQFHTIVDNESDDPLFFDEMPIDKSHPKVMAGEVETQSMFLKRSASAGQKITDHNSVAKVFLEEHVPKLMEAENAADDEIHSEDLTTDSAFAWIKETDAHLEDDGDNELQGTLDLPTFSPVIDLIAEANGLAETNQAAIEEFSYEPTFDENDCTIWPEAPLGYNQQELIADHLHQETLNFVPLERDLDFCFQNNWCSGAQFPCRDYVCSRRCRECYNRCYGYTTAYKADNLNCACRRGIQLLLDQEADKSGLKYEMLNIALEACPRPSAVLEKAGSVIEHCPSPANHIGQWFGDNNYNPGHEKFQELIKNMASNGIRGTK